MTPEIVLPQFQDAAEAELVVPIVLVTICSGLYGGGSFAKMLPR
jgi:predicted benzoate:H+ symporter BenE